MTIAAGIDVNAVGSFGYTPCHYAAYKRPELCIPLLEAGANPNAVTTSGGATPLHLAAAQGSADAVAALLDRGAQVNAKDGSWAQTPIMWAAAYNRVAVLDLLVARGADYKATSKVEDIPARSILEGLAFDWETYGDYLRALDAMPEVEKTSSCGTRR